MVLSVAAILLLILLQFVGRLTTRFQARHILTFGWITLALGMYLTCKRIDLFISFGAATWLRILQYLPVGFLFVPLTMAGYVGVPREKTNAAAGLMNFMRNIGQSVGTSAVTTLIARRSNTISPFSLCTRGLLTSMRPWLTWRRACHVPGLTCPRLDIWQLPDCMAC